MVDTLLNLLIVMFPPLLPILYPQTYLLRTCLTCPSSMAMATSQVILRVGAILPLQQPKKLTASSSSFTFLSSIPSHDLRSRGSHGVSRATTCTRAAHVDVFASAPAQAATRSAEADVMGLLLRQRIVFLGAEMNDFVADAIVSQLLLLDAQDPNKPIRLFVNSPGGSMRSALARLLCAFAIFTVRRD